MCSAAFHSHPSVHATPCLAETLNQAQAFHNMSAEHLFSISHELRTPMNAIMGFSQLLRMEPLSPLQADSVDEIEKASQRMLALINDLLDLNKINAGRMSLDIEPLALEASARNCMQQLAPLAQASGAEAPTDPHQLTGLTYVSTAARPMSGTDLNSIVQDSKTFNATVDVTGVLLYHDGNFFQYLEGPRQGLEQVMERVCKSRRHHTLYVHFKGEIAQRHFGDWSMDVADLSQPRTRQHTTSLRELEQTWNSDPSTCVGVRHLLNFAEHMTGRAYWATPKTLHPPSA